MKELKKKHKVVFIKYRTSDMPDFTNDVAIRYSTVNSAMKKVMQDLMDQGKEVIYLFCVRYGD